MLNSRDISLLRPDVETNCRIWLNLCKIAGLKVLIVSTVRDDEYQAYLYQQGRTRPGSIVTNGRYPTFHWDKAGLAFDFCKNVKGHEYDDPEFFKKAADIAKAIGFSWGGDWTSFVDMPHLQWDDGCQYTSSDVRAKKFPPMMPKYTQYKTLSRNSMIRSAQRTLQDMYDFWPTHTGSWNKAHKTAMVKAMQTEINNIYGAQLIVDGQWGNASKNSCPDIKSGTNNLILLIQACLVVKGYDIQMDSIYGTETTQAIKRFQKKYGLKVDGIAGANTITKLLS